MYYLSDKEEDFMLKQAREELAVKFKLTVIELANHNGVTGSPS
jgi:hypothetical protein